MLICLFVVVVAVVVAVVVVFYSRRKERVERLRFFSVKASLRKHPFLVAPHRWGRFARRNVCDLATEIPY